MTNPYQQQFFPNYNIPSYGMAYQQQKAAEQQPMFQQSVNMPQQQVPQGLNGRVVANVDSIGANDVPMDGTVAIFPLSDMSQIIVKTWQADGNIHTTRYKPILDDVNTQANTLSNNAEKLKIGLSEDVRTALDTIENKLDSLIASTSKTAGKRITVPKRESDCE